MSIKPVVILVHGMGKHSPGAMKAEFIDSLNAPLQKISDHQSSDIDQLLDIREINYDGFFDEMRHKMADNAQSIEQRLNSIDEVAGLPWGPDLVLKLSSLEARYKEDKLLYTHWLDVLFYSTMLGAKVRTDAAQKISEILSETDAGTPVHIIAHSLGTAVVHDALAQLYRGDFIGNDNIPDLGLFTHRLKSVWMIANVSRLMNEVTDISHPYKSSVKPSDTGCMDYMYNVHHQLDPFTWLCPFDPDNNNRWISRDYFEAAYRDIETSTITRVNTHNFGEYIRNPKVALPLLARLTSIYPSHEDKETIADAFRQRSIPGAYEAMTDALGDIDVRDQASLKHFLVTAKAFSDVIERFRSELNLSGNEEGDEG